MMRLVIRELFHMNGYGIWVMKREGGDGRGGKTLVAKPTKLEFADDQHFALPEPTFTIQAEDLESLVASGQSQLECSGLGRMLNVASDAELRAVRQHLDDVRALVPELAGLERGRR